MRPLLDGADADRHQFATARLDGGALTETAGQRQQNQVRRAHSVDGGDERDCDSAAERPWAAERLS